MGAVYVLTLRNDRAEVARIAAWIDKLAGSLCLPQDAKYALQLCLEEAVSNIVSHAFRPGTSHDVHISLWRDATSVHAQVADDGRPFDPLSHKLPPAPSDLESAPIGGLGVKLMRNFCEHMAYQRVEAMNRLTLSFPLCPLPMPNEVGGPKGPEPTRYGDWEVNGRCGDF